MKHRIAICVGLMALGIASAPSAQAQGYYYGPPRIYAAPPVMHDPVVPPGEVLMLVRAAGLSPLTQPARRGPRYVLLASDRMGGQLRVVVSAYDGRILRVMPAHDPRFAYNPVRPHAVVPVPPAHYGAPPRPHYSEVPPPELKDPPPVVRGSRSTAPVPPAVQGSRNAPPATTGSTHDPRLASAPPAADPTPRRPARTPLPRPRPATASNETAATPQPTETVAAPPTPPAAQPPASAAPAATQSRPAPRPAETQLVPVAPLD